MALRRQKKAGPFELTSRAGDISIFPNMERTKILSSLSRAAFAVLCLVLVCSGFASVLHAEEAAPVGQPPVEQQPSRYVASFPASDWTLEKTYTDKISHKLGFGFLNITAGWTAFFYEPALAKNFFAGLATGTLYTFTNTVGGVLHAATFPIPLDIPLPHGGISYEYNR